MAQSVQSAVVHILLDPWRLHSVGLLFVRSAKARYRRPAHIGGADQVARYLSVAVQAVQHGAFAGLSYRPPVPPGTLRCPGAAGEGLIPNMLKRTLWGAGPGRARHTPADELGWRGMLTLLVARSLTRKPNLPDCRPPHVRGARQARRTSNPCW
jgi:hypothetical protein